MKFKTVFILTMIFVLFVLSFSQEKRIRENVIVTNVEIPVRVFCKGKIVEDIKREDFSLFVNGERRNITGFSLVKKQLADKGTELSPKNGESRLRHFIIDLNITKFSPEIKKGVDYILNNVLRENDSVLFFINGTTKLFKNFKDKDGITDQIYKHIETESKKAHVRMMVYFKDIERTSRFRKFKLAVRGRSGGLDQGERDIYFMNEFLKNYLIIWKDYKRRYLRPNVNTYNNFAKYLQNVKREKWVISFFQVEMFPKIVLNGTMLRVISSKISNWQVSENLQDITFSRIISRQFNSIQKALSVGQGFPTKQITKILTKVGVTFHSVFIPSAFPDFIRNMEYTQISSDLRNNLKSLTKKNGGELVSTKDLEKEMDRIVRKQDIYYVLNYVPKEGEKIKSVNIKLSNKKYKLEYNDGRKLDISEFGKKYSSTIKVPSVNISDLKFKKKKLSFSISNYLMRKNQKGGVLNVRIRINDNFGKSVFDKSKTLKTTKDKVDLSLGFGWLKSGNYEIIVDVKDLNTDKTDTDVIKIN